MGRNKKQPLWSLNGREANEENESDMPLKLTTDKRAGTGLLYEDSPKYDGRPTQKRLSDEEEALLMEVQAAFDAGVLENLSERERDCFISVMISNETYEVVSKRLRVTRSTVQYCVNRAAKKIRKFIERNNG